MDPIIGIDLGTTNSVAAWLADDGPRLIPNALGQPLTPSVVGVDPDGHLLVGAPAKELRVTHPERTASLFKRQMGGDWKAELAGRTYSPEELSSLVLAALKADAEAALDRPVHRAVVTVPAYFNDRQRKATIAAGKIAGLDVERILNEPTAAALAYGFHESRTEKLLLILDLGGGTFDVSIVEVFDGTIEVRASAGESFLGGEDFTRNLAARLLETQGLTYERAEMQSPRMVARLIQQCEIAKCRLARHDTAEVRMPDRDGNLSESTPPMNVAREQFETWTAPTLARIELPIRRVLGDAKIAREQISEIILVGGATRMPAVVRRVAELLGKEPQQRFNPDEVVALGAAVQAGLFARSAVVDDLVVTDVAPFTLGVEIAKQLGPDRRTGYFLPIIERNTTIPVSRVDRVGTLEPNQTVIKVRIFQGEGRRVEDNLLLGEFELTGIPRGPAGQEVDIRFTYDLNGILEVEATVVATNKKVAHVITRHAHGMTAEQVKAAVRDLAKLKRHPREETDNRFLLRRAERVFQELAHEDRQFLMQLLDGFETALGMQDPSAIEVNREALREFLDRFDSDGLGVHE
jgi:molecular chaperone HscC